MVTSTVLYSLGSLFIKHTLNRTSSNVIIRFFNKNRTFLQGWIRDIFHGTGLTKVDQVHGSDFLVKHSLSNTCSYRPRCISI